MHSYIVDNLFYYVLMYNSCKFKVCELHTAYFCDTLVAQKYANSFPGLVIFGKSCGLPLRPEWTFITENHKPSGAGLFHSCPCRRVGQSKFLL